MRFFFLSCFSLFVLLHSSFSQTPYTQNLFLYDSVMNVEYGVATNYAGNADTLKLDIYKPLGDSNCLRPIIIFIHGGAWIGGSKEDFNMVYMSRQLAKKGWVVANINYRLGTHKTSNYCMYALCNNSISQPCGYICDSAEVYRANYRAMQDAKGAIRFMKNRNTIDSTDINNVFVAGESAGGFVAMAAAFVDQTSEKHSSCFSISNAPTPDPDMNTYGCVPSPTGLSRPDLGTNDGVLHLGQNNATVKGVGSFYGGILDLSYFSQTTDTPVVYMFHQGSDVVVHYDYGTLLGRTSWECYAQTNICQSYYYYPKAYGSEGIKKHFVSLGSNAPMYQADIISNYNYLNNCFSNGHSIDNIALRTQNMANLFASKIALSGNHPQTNCLNNSVLEKRNNPISLFPNPTPGLVSFTGIGLNQNLEYQLYNTLGACVKTGIISNRQNTIDLYSFPPGLYFIHIYSSSIINLKLIKQ